jgi:YD repeat-containing protein
MTPASITLPTGAGSQRATDYDNLSSSSTLTYEDGGVTKTLMSTTSHDGWGRVIQTVDLNNAQVNTGYDAMGRVTSRTNPFTAGGPPGPSTTTQYDIANRAVIMTLPDGNTVRTDYSGSRVTATDQAGRKMKRDTDGLGRLVKVTEQDVTGALIQETSYAYNLLDKLTLVNQGGQQRRYKYDALGRLLFERIPEQTATINDGTGTYWSTKYTYTQFNAVLTKQDASGAIITYGYDALHRVNSISYDTANASGVASTPSVSLSYDTGGGLSSVTVGNQFTETYNYDSYHRAQSVTRWVLGQVNDSRKTYTTSYEYNQASQLTKISYPSGFHVDPSYDDRGRMAEFLYDKDNAWQGGYITNLAYNPAGQVSGLSLGNGVAETYTYDLLGRLVTSNQTSNGVSAQRRFDYDRWGNRTGVWNATSGGTRIQSTTLEQSGGVPTNRITSLANSGITSNYI